jgi:hypothetical protein
MSPAFAFLRPFGPLHRSARKAMGYAEDDSNHALIEIRKFGETLTTMLANAASPPVRAGTTHDQQVALHERGVLPRNVYEALGRCRRVGNAAVHGDEDDARLVRVLLQDVHDIAAWFVVREGHPCLVRRQPWLVGPTLPAVRTQRTHPR